MAPMPPWKGSRITMAMSYTPSERLRNLATCDTIWSKAGKTKPSNCISHTGR